MKKYLLLIWGLASLLCGYAQNPVLVHLNDGAKDRYNMSFVDSLYANTQKQFLNMRFPLSQYEIVRDNEMEEDIHWEPSTTEEQKETIKEIVRQMIYVQGGSTWIGCQSTDITGQNYYQYAQEGEYPVHMVTVDGFYMNKFELTRKQWKAIMGYDNSRFTTSDRHPADGISWENAIEFIEKINSLSSVKFRMPTEAEWEYAASGASLTHHYLFAGSNYASDVAWTNDNVAQTMSATSHEVGLLSPNELGLYDMSGNVFEWTSDWYGEYNTTDLVNPQGPAIGTLKVLRGGCYMLPERNARVTARFGFSPSMNNYSGIIIPAGIRLVCDGVTTPVLTLSETFFEADKNGCEFTVEVTSNSPFTIKEQPTWCTCTVTGNHIVIAVNANVSGTDRYGQIVVATGQLEATITIHQENLIQVTGDLPTPDDIIRGIVWNPSATEAERALVKGIVNNLVCVQGSSFFMGAQAASQADYNYDPSAQANEMPVHSVNLSSFYLDKFEITQKEWKVLMENHSFFNYDENLPVETVSWNDANEFIEKLNNISNLKFSIPTEAQWEYAARGGKNSNGYIYSGSNTPTDVAWFSANANVTTHKGGLLAPNEIGIYDMSGNVFEWTADWMGQYTSENGLWNPTGPDAGTEKVGRGGTHILDANYLRVALRMATTPDTRSFMGMYTLPVGVRVALNYAENISVNLGAEDETIVINLGTDDAQGAVTIPEGLDWCHATVSNGKMYVSVQTNRSGAVREMDFTAATHTKRIIVHVVQDFKETTLRDVIPEELTGLIDDGIITYNPGVNPPNVEGCYYVDNNTVVSSSLGNSDIGYTACPMYFKLYNQTSSNIIDYQSYETAGTHSVGPGAFLTGEGNLFSAFFTINGEYDDGVTTFKQAIIVSGKKTSQGIADYSFTFVLTDKNDPYSTMVPVGTYRSFVETGDGVAQNATWPLNSPQRWLAPDKKSPYPSMLSLPTTTK